MNMEPELIETDGAKAVLYRDAPLWEGKKCAAVGGMDFNSSQAGAGLLNRISAQLKSEGFYGLLGPMDGDTWHAYRLVTFSDGSEPFLLEPVSCAHDVEALGVAGFSPVSDYVSARGKLADTLGPAPVTPPGISVTAWEGNDAEQLIIKLYEMSVSSFAQNRFFKPIGLEAFLEIYRPLFGMVDPAHILFAHSDEGQLVGFLFGMPDRSKKGGKPPTVILKTYASGVRGVGHLLADTYHRRAIDMGFEEVIHALMQEDNLSLKRSAQHKAVIFRRYALLGKVL